MRLLTLASIHFDPHNITIITDFIDIKYEQVDMLHNFYHVNFLTRNNNWHKTNPENCLSPELPRSFIVLKGNLA